MSNKFIIDQDTNRIDIDLRENILLEASAGTGKTYSLERVVLNLIKYKKYNLSIKDILVVTFTNKATREMKERIRKILIDDFRSCKDLEERSRLEVAISEFDEAAIFTIHGFCQNTLQTYPFESGSLFSQEISNDDTIIEAAVWDYLRDLESSSDEDTINEYYAFKGNSSFKDVVAKIVGIYKKDIVNDSISIIPDSSDRVDIYKIINEYNSGSGNLVKLINEFKNYPASELHLASKEMGARTTIKSFEKLASFFESLDLDSGFEDFANQFFSKDSSDILYKLTPKFLESKSKKGNKAGELIGSFRDIVFNAEALFMELEPLVDMENLKKNPLDSFYAGEFIKKAIPEIGRIFKKKQESAGALSYNDLIDNLHRGVTDSNNKSLLNSLRKRYKIALIDEFQDTDAKQWDIFSSIFGDSPDHNFLLIGDPKQSIYGFRGADLEIYYRAKKSIPDNNHYFLGTNYRSEKGIVQGVNKIFKEVFKTESLSNGGQTEFDEVENSNKDPLNLDGSDENIEFLYFDKDVVKEGDLLKANECKLGYFKVITEKIVNLLNNNQDSLTPGDISILVESHKDSKILMDMLLKRSVPVVISKQKNVYKSAEADAILLFLKALNRPGGNSQIRALLLSSIFGYTVADIHKMEDEGSLEIFSTLLLTWNNKLDSSGIISVWKEVEDASKKGHLQTRLLSRVNGERAYTNFKHLVEDLDQLQKRERLNSLELSIRLHNLMETASDDEENSVRLDRDSKAVQIMTMHASKGLEFPVVFFAGGLTSGVSRGVQRDPGIKFIDKNSNQAYDFLSKNSSKVQEISDLWEEKKRLYYVAFTRAVSKLYLPLFSNSEPLGITSLYSSLEWEGIKKDIEDLAGDKLERVIQPVHKLLKIDNAAITKSVKNSLSRRVYEDISSQFKVDEDTYENLSGNLYSFNKKVENLSFTDINQSFRHRVTWVSSYSGLTRDSHGSISKEDADRADDTEVEARVFVKSDELNNFNFPGGATFGDLIHEFFEEIDFDKHKLNLNDFIEDEDVNNLFLICAKKHFNLDWAKKSEIVVKTIIWNTLNSRLKLGEDRVLLGEITKENRIHEREFYFRVDKHITINTHGLELNFEEGYLKGFIDLIFNHNGTYYIADWKSTTIKGDEKFDTYNKDAVNLSMNEHNYHLQGLIYSVALYLYLKECNPSFDYNRDFGGYYYFYVRGMNPDSDTGVSFRKPGESEILNFIKEIRGDYEN